MRTKLVKIVLPLTVAIFLSFTVGQMFSPNHGFDTNQFARFKAQFESGDTNAPLLAMDWFFRGNHFCRVSQSGNMSAALDVGYAIEGGNRGLLDTANMFLLVKAINELPPQSNGSLPQDRQVIVGGIRSNQWFQCVYDRGNVPVEVERLYEITRAHLEWFIPKVNGRVISHSENGNSTGSQAMINSFAVASDAPIAVSTGVNGLQLWDLNKSSAAAILPLDTTPYYADLWSVATLSPDGRIIIFTGGDGINSKTIYAFDWQKKEALWEINQADVGNTYEAGDRIFATGNNGHSLFISQANCIEHWDMATGTKITTLATNQTGIKYLQASRNGKYLLVGFGDNSFTVWKTDNDEPLFQFSEPEELAGVALSSDGQKVMLCTREQRSRFVLWDLGLKKRVEVPLRIPSGSLSAQSLYWSPDDKWVAANVDTYPSSIVIYEAATWKPKAQWPCEQVMSSSQFAFRNDGVFLELRDHDISGLDMTKSETSSGNQSPELSISEPEMTATNQPSLGDKDFQDFQDRVKKLVDPLRLQSLAIPIINQQSGTRILSDYNQDFQNVEFLQLAHRIYGYRQADTGGIETNNNGKSVFIRITCAGKDFYHIRGLVIGNKDFAGPKFDKNYEVVPWAKGVYFWNDVRDHSKR